MSKQTSDNHETGEMAVGDDPVQEILGAPYTEQILPIKLPDDITGWRRAGYSETDIISALLTMNGGRRSESYQVSFVFYELGLGYQWRFEAVFGEGVPSWAANQIAENVADTFGDAGEGLLTGFDPHSGSIRSQGFVSFEGLFRTPTGVQTSKGFRKWLESPLMGGAVSPFMVNSPDKRPAGFQYCVALPQGGVQSWGAGLGVSYTIYPGVMQGSPSLYLHLTMSEGIGEWGEVVSTPSFEMLEALTAYVGQDFPDWMEGIDVYLRQTHTCETPLSLWSEGFGPKSTMADLLSWYPRGLEFEGVEFSIVLPAGLWRRQMHWFSQLVGTSRRLVVGYFSGGVADGKPLYEVVAQADMEHHSVTFFEQAETSTPGLGMSDFDL